MINGEVIITDEQTEGRGQRGNVWESQKGKNLTFSFGVFDLELPVLEQFRLHFIVSLALVKTINDNTLVTAKIKWPNDIYIGDKKIGGILIENTIRKNEIYSSVIGIGFNVNQTEFKTSTATSLALETNQENSQEEFLVSFLENFEHFLFRKEDKKSLENLYLANMYKLNELSFFEDEGGVFEGEIMGIDTFGLLEIKKNTGLVTYGFKEVKYLFSER